MNIAFIRDHAEQVKKDSKRKGVEVDIDKIIKLDEKYRKIITDLEAARMRKNELSKELADPEVRDKSALAKQAGDVKKQVAKLEDEMKPIEQELNDLLINVPNVMHESVPTGKDDTENEVVHKYGEKPVFDFEIKDHLELGQSLGLIDMKSAAEVSGSRFYYLKGDLVLLEQALIFWITRKMVNHGFVPVQVPNLVREKMMEATGFFPAERNEIYHVNPEDDDLYLAGTSEVPLTGLHLNNDLTEADLPKMYLGQSTCYRREAGSYGKDTKGIFRVHQFNKLEMYVYAHPEESWEIHDKLLSFEEEIMSELGLHYQVVNVCSGDLGAPAAKKYDIEAWIPSQEKYRELTSCSNVTDFQATRAKIKYRRNDGELEYVHTLNGTAMASTRTIIAIMENYQTEDGRIKVPKVLQEFMGGKEII